MFRNARLLLLSLSLIVVLATACTSSAATQNLAGTQWKLTALNGKPPFAAGNPVVLNFDSSNQISGNSGCNSYGGEYTASGNTLSLSKVFSTLMACADQSVNDQEAAFHLALGKVVSFEISNGQLNLKDAGGIVLMTFSKV